MARLQGLNRFENGVKNSSNERTRLLQQVRVSQVVVIKILVALHVANAISATVKRARF